MLLTPYVSVIWTAFPAPTTAYKFPTPIEDEVVISRRTDRREHDRWYRRRAIQGNRHRREHRVHSVGQVQRAIVDLDPVHPKKPRFRVVARHELVGGCDAVRARRGVHGPDNALATAGREDRGLVQRREAVEGLRLYKVVGSVIAGAELSFGNATLQICCDIGAAEMVSRLKLLAAT